MRMGTAVLILGAACMFVVVTVGIIEAQVVHHFIGER
jgi:hypothetical protein